MGPTSLTNKSLFKKKKCLSLYLGSFSWISSSLLYTPTIIQRPFIPSDTTPDYFVSWFFTLHWQLSILDLAALDILFFNSNISFLSPYTKDMLKRPWQLPLRTFIHRLILGYAAVKLVIFLTMTSGELESLYLISYSWMHFHNMIEIPLSFSDHNMLSFSLVKCLMHFH